MKDAFLSPEARAQDILLGSLGFDEAFTIIELQRTPKGYEGIAKDAQAGDEIPFVSDDDLDELQLWALKVLGK